MANKSFKANPAPHDTKNMNDHERIKLLAIVLASYANDEQCSVIHNFVSRQETTDRERVMELISALYDGIAWGNWPWIRWQNRSETERKNHG